MKDEKIKRCKMEECYSCIHKRDIPGKCHICCDNPSPSVRGDLHGVYNGWFIYPTCFDPVWKTTYCDNYKSINE